MTKKYIDWDKLDKAKEDGLVYEQELKARDNLENDIRKLEAELVSLKGEKEEKPEEPKSFKELAILSAILFRGYGEPYINEANVVKVTDDTITVRVTTGYNYYDFVKIDIPIEELKNNQFYFDTKYSIFICDRVTKYEGFKTIMDAIFKEEKAQKVKRLGWIKEQIAKYEEECSQLEKEITTYDNIPIGRVEKMINKVNFATGWSSYEFDTKTNFLDNLPRVYKV